jgi:hypothetical protein
MNGVALRKLFDQHEQVALRKLLDQHERGRPAGG